MLSIFGIFDHCDRFVKEGHRILTIRNPGWTAIRTYSCRYLHAGTVSSSEPLPFPHLHVTTRLDRWSHLYQQILMIVPLSQEVKVSCAGLAPSQRWN
ncbi:hypothetical protein J6590_051833 [Homalodisca vitripennis]|nr:hypothetical protein J6590_051833 [Homalodisca vitripennis]